MSQFEASALSFFAPNKMKLLFLLLVAALPLATTWAGEPNDPDVAPPPKELTNPEMKWRAASAKDKASAQYNLGVMYGQGKGVVQDYAEAVKWYRLAADQGIVSAQYNLGWSYDHGKGVAQDYAEALRWYTLAAKQGHVRAQYRLGGMYYDGQGVPQDYIKAHMWFNLSATTGDPDATKSRDFSAKLLTGQQIGQAQKMARELQVSSAKKYN